MTDELQTPHPQIDCIDCGGRCHLITQPAEDGRWYPGDLITYRCEDCLDRWDLLMPGGPDEHDDEHGHDVHHDGPGRS